MNFTDQELAEFTRPVTPQEGEIFDRTVEELFTKGFIQSNENVLKLYRAFDRNPQIPITRDNILESTRVYRNVYEWKSQAEMEFEKFSAQLGPEKSQIIRQFIPSYRLSNEGEDLFTNFNLLAEYCLQKNMPVTRDALNRIVITSVQRSPKGYLLIWAATPDERRRAKELEELRKPGPQKSAFEIAKAKADAVGRAVNPATGRKYADEIMEAYHENNPTEPETPAQQVLRTPALDPEQEYWKSRCRDHIRTIPRKIMREEFEAEFSKPKNGSWEMTYRLLKNALEKAGVR